jgi:Ca2+-binding RTX toxin-like protein
MKKHLIMIAVFGFLALGLNASQLEANFVQCPVIGGPCGNAEGTTINADVINGSATVDEIAGDGGNDLVFGHEGNDSLFGNLDDDVLFGGLGSDYVDGGHGNDILFAGPDDGVFRQDIWGDLGQDTANVLVGETTTCLFIANFSGEDSVNLLGFGPYTATKPFGQPGFVDGFIYLVDPISGGGIFIYVSEANDEGTETINGLLSPNATIVPTDDPIVEACPEGVIT